MTEPSLTTESEDASQQNQNSNDNEGSNVIHAPNNGDPAKETPHSDSNDRKDSNASASTSGSSPSTNNNSGKDTEEETPIIEVEGVEAEVETLVSRDGVELWSKSWKVY
jgi:hypothetical protein